MTEMLEEEKQNEEAKRQEQTMYEKEDDLPQAEEEPQTKSASQLAAEAIPPLAGRGTGKIGD